MIELHPGWFVLLVVLALFGFGAILFFCIDVWKHAVLRGVKKRTRDLEQQADDLRKLYDARNQLVIDQERTIAQLKGTPFRTGAEGPS